MARKRMIDPTIWEDENFGKLSPRAKILFIGLFSNADDEGRIRANDSYLRSTVFMYDDISLTDVRQLVDEVTKHIKTVVLYESQDGNRYIELKKWEEYQKQREDRIQKSVLPSSNSESVRQLSDKCQTDDGHLSAEVKLDKDKLDEVKIVGSMHASLKNITDEDLKEIAEKYKVPISFVMSKLDDMNNWQEAKGKKYRNYKAALANWVKTDALKIKQEYHGKSKVFDATRQ